MLSENMAQETERTVHTCVRFCPDDLEVIQLFLMPKIQTPALDLEEWVLLNHTEEELALLLSESRNGYHHDNQFFRANQFWTFISRAPVKKRKDGKEIEVAKSEVGNWGKWRGCRGGGTISDSQTVIGTKNKKILITVAGLKTGWSMMEYSLRSSSFQQYVIGHLIFMGNTQQFEPPEYLTLTPDSALNPTQPQVDAARAAFETPASGVNQEAANAIRGFGANASFDNAFETQGSGVNQQDAAGAALETTGNIEAAGNLANPTLNRHPLIVMEGEEAASRIPNVYSVFDANPSSSSLDNATAIRRFGANDDPFSNWYGDSSLRYDDDPGNLLMGQSSRTRTDDIEDWSPDFEQLYSADKSMQKKPRLGDP